jgi:hypothetical protein
MWWFLIAWIGICWGIGAVTGAGVGCALFIASIIFLITRELSGNATAATIITVLFIFLPKVVEYLQSLEQAAAKMERDRTSQSEYIAAAEQQRFDDEIQDAFSALQYAENDGEAIQLCHDFIQHYSNGKMDNDVCRGFGDAIIAKAKPLLDAKRLQEEQEEAIYVAAEQRRLEDERRQLEDEQRQLKERHVPKSDQLKG